MKIKRLNKDIKLPTKAYNGDAGFDIYAPYRFAIWPHDKEQIKLGLMIEIAQDEVCIMSERSGMAIKFGITSIGNVIDSSYRGEISIILVNITEKKVIFETGDKIGQMLILKLGNQRLEETNDLSKSERGEKAHYSSGK